MAFRDVQPWNEEEIEDCWVRVSWLENAQCVEDLAFFQTTIRV